MPPYSEKRMLITINVLKKYEIDIHNNDLIDMLIEEAKLAQIQCDYITLLKKPLKTVGAIIVNRLCRTKCWQCFYYRLDD